EPGSRGAVPLLPGASGRVSRPLRAERGPAARAVPRGGRRELDAVVPRRPPADPPGSAIPTGPAGASLHGVAGSGLARDVAAGSIAALVTLTYSFSYAALIWSGPALEPFLAAGLHAALIAASVQALVVALTSSLPFAIAGPDSNATAILAVMAASL